MENISHLALLLGQALKNQSLTLVTAESCTGGWIAQEITAHPGSSDIFERGFVTYSELSKQEMLGVSKTNLEKQGAVSQAVAKEMAEGALKHSNADVSIAVTGIAGPTSDESGKPVGLIWFGFAGKKFPTETIEQQFSGNRQQIRQQAVVFSLEHLLKKLQSFKRS